MKPNIFTVDLEFQGIPKAIASYLIPHNDGIVMIESGPGSTVETLENKLNLIGYQLTDITDLLLTHIHLDHAGAAGYLARHGAMVHVHQVGAPHMREPERLLESATRIYGNMMDALWGEFLPVPAENIHVLTDGAVLELHGLEFQAIDTPGHAYHHMAYLYEDICFSGDIGGVRIPVPHKKHIRIPMPPPELHLGLWLESVEKLEKFKFNKIAPTHFGIYDDQQWHLSDVKRKISIILDWIDKIMPEDPDIETLRAEFIEWTQRVSEEEGLSVQDMSAFEAANPSGMSAEGIQRYWNKHRKPD